MRSHRGIAVRLCRSAVSSREPCRDGCFLAAKQAQHLSMLPTNRGAWSVADSLRVLGAPPRKNVDARSPERPPEVLFLPACHGSGSRQNGVGEGGGGRITRK